MFNATKDLAVLAAEKKLKELHEKGEGDFKLKNKLQYLQQFGKGPIPTLTGIGTNILSRLNPLVAGPLQAVTGRQFFSQDPSGVATEANKRWPLVAGLAKNIGGRLMKHF